jgi:hypothetical protein
VRRAFLSSMPFVTTGGINSADTLCQNDATAVSMPGTFHALLGLTGATPISRFDLGRTVWTRVDGVALAATTADFAAGNTIASLNVTAAGAYVPEGVSDAWTSGVPTMTSSALTTCNDWSSNAPGANAHGGLWTASGPNAFEQVVVISCQVASNRLYCLEL